ncbi:MAG: hypothetical protein LBD33_02085 [Puniceicoccales bacterium]|jgi:hypothetical protein|nr:hypothetical protein [Puniceicoccales bacterium]
MDTSKVTGSEGKALEDFQPVATGDEMLQAKRKGEIGAARSGGVQAVEKMMQAATPDGDIGSRQAEVESAFRQVLRLRGGGGNGKISEFRGAVEHVKTEVVGRFSQAAAEMAALEQLEQLLGDDQPEEALQSGIDNLRSLVSFVPVLLGNAEEGDGGLEFDQNFVAATICEQLKVVASKVRGEDPLYFPQAGLRSFGEIFAMLGKGSVAPLLEQFRSEFLPRLRDGDQASLPQFEAEKRNLRHMILCADEMLTPVGHGGLEFNQDFVARVVSMRLEIVMFDFHSRMFDFHSGHRPVSMFDFGPERAHVALQPFQTQVPGRSDGVSRAVDHTYLVTGRAASPDNSPSDSPRQRMPFSFLRGNPSASNPLGLYYTMPNGQQTICLPKRFRQFLQAKIGNRWDALGLNTPLIELPLAMMFLVGLQFGQINVGTWNPFTLAAKRYFALQSCDSSDEISGRFFWQDGTAPSFDAASGNYGALLVEAFKPVLENAELKLPRG